MNIKASGHATSTTYIDKLCSIIGKCKLTKYDRAKTLVPVKKVIDKIESEIIRDDCGNGAERKMELTEVWYDYNAV